jgi:hypothetical protein
MPSDSSVTDKELEAFGRFLKLLPHGKDSVLVVLKGHLLIEELLRRVVAERVKKPEALEAAEFECRHVIALAEALCAKEIESWMWTAIVKVNELRNKIAHNLEPPSHKDRMAHIISLVRENSVFAEDGFGTGDKAVQFEFALWVLYANLIALLVKPSARILRLVPGSK